MLIVRHAVGVRDYLMKDVYSRPPLRSLVIENTGWLIFRARIICIYLPEESEAYGLHTCLVHAIHVSAEYIPDLIA